VRRGWESACRRSDSLIQCQRPRQEEMSMELSADDQHPEDTANPFVGGRLSVMLVVGIVKRKKVRWAGSICDGWILE
jgi:hypothetical protein